MNRLPSTPDRKQLLLRALEDILLPLARLCVGHGVPYPHAEELFKRAYVRAARDARRAAGTASRRDVSQVAMATGLSRRDVDRISAALRPRALQRLSPATQVFTRWLTDPDYRHRNGRPRKLPRQGPAPSFEALSTAVTRHVHPRSLLDELLRLGLVALTDQGDSVVLQKDRAVPQPDDERLFTLLAGNIGDHLAAAADNVLHGERRHLEQAVFAHGLSDAAVAAADELVQRQWRRLLGELAPALERLIEADRTAGRAGGQRLRVGLYSYHEDLPGEDHEAKP